MKRLTTTLTIAALAAFTLTLSPTRAADKKQENSHEGQAGHMLEGYLAVSDALYRDDLEAAKKAAKDMIKHDEHSALAKPAAKLAEGKDLRAAREAFKTMSAEAVKIAEAHEEGKYTVMNCPMVRGGGGDWLSADGKVNNPCFGPKMPHCGGPK